MKKVLLLTAAVLISGSAMAQHEHFHVFRNDKQFNTFNNVQETVSYTHLTLPTT